MGRGHERGRVILVVDPSADTRMMYVQFLRLASGVLVAAADSAGDAVRFCQEIRPDGIVADLGLRTEAGATFCDDIRSIVGPDTCIVAVSGPSLSREQETNCTILEKPVDPKQLLESLGLEWSAD
jgi:CheY-like chemotaxis protein